MCMGIHIEHNKAKDYASTLDTRHYRLIDSI